MVNLFFVANKPPSPLDKIPNYRFISALGEPIRTPDHQLGKAISQHLGFGDEVIYHSLDLGSPVSQDKRKYRQ